MIKPDESPALGVAQQQRNRAHARRKLAPMAYVELGQDNGGILLNLSEGGFAVQSALALTSRDFTGLRFQVPQVQGWLTASGKIAWISDSKKEAGIQFTQLPGQARAAIQRWVATEEKPKVAGDEVAPKSWDRKANIFSAPARAQTAPVPIPARENGKNPGPGAVPRARPEPSRTAPAAVTAAAPPVAAARPIAAAPSPVTASTPETPSPAHDFHFTDYSMFSAEPEREPAWVRPQKKSVGWGTLTLLALVLSGLFFVLGAILGRGRVESWITATTGWQMQKPTPTQGSATEATPQPDVNQQQQAPDGSATASSGQEASSPEASATPENRTDTSASARGNATASPPASSSTVPPDQAPNRTSPQKKEPSIAARNNAAAKSSGARASAARAEESYPRTPQPRSYDDIGAGAPVNPSEHAILVNAPAPGSPPFSVNLSSDAVSASSTVAISAQHSMIVAPRSGSYGLAQRVVIGKLVTHGEPFYPADARTKRIQGSVLLHVTIGRTGHVVAVAPVRGPTELAKAATTAVRDWRYEPTYVDGDPVETQADVTFVFRLP